MSFLAEALAISVPFDEFSNTLLLSDERFGVVVAVASISARRIGVVNLLPCPSLAGIDCRLAVVALFQAMRIHFRLLTPLLTQRNNRDSDPVPSTECLRLTALPRFWVPGSSRVQSEMT